MVEHFHGFSSVGGRRPWSGSWITWPDLSAAMTWDFPTANKRKGEHIDGCVDNIGLRIVGGIGSSRAFKVLSLAKGFQIFPKSFLQD